MLFLAPYDLDAQTENNDKLFMDSCGIIAEPDSYKKDKFFGDNQQLVDILLNHGVAINENYLENLDSGDEMLFMSPERFAAYSPVYYIPIKAWVYRNNNGLGNITISQVKQVISNLNGLFTPNTNIKFFLICDVSLVNNSNYANNAALYLNTIFEDNKIDGAINLHFIINSGSNWIGHASWPWDSPNFASAIVTNPDFFFVDIPKIANTAAHEIGHNLGLLHTHHPGRSKNDNTNEECGDCFQESVSRSKTQGLFCISTIGQKKCEVNGDYLCDTEADPLLFGRVNSSCIYTYGGSDNWGDPWTPNTNNFMSYSLNPACRNYFTPLQVAKMYGYISDIGINNPPFVISGPDSLCRFQIATYSVNTLPNNSNYIWSVPSTMSILSGQGTNTIQVEALFSGGGTITVTPDCGSKPAFHQVQDVSSVTVNGYDSGCPGQTYTYSTPLLQGASYNWTVIENANIVTGQGTNTVQVLINNGSSGQSFISVIVSGYCSTSISGNKIISHGNPPPPAPSCFEPPQGKNIELDTKVDIATSLDMLLYPNPSKNFVKVVAPDFETYDIIIFNSLGQALYKKEKAVFHKYNIDISAYEDGIYFIYLIGEKTYNKRLIIKK